MSKIFNQVSDSNNKGVIMSNKEEPINTTPLDIDKVKDWAKKNKDYVAEYFLCLMPEEEPSSPFADSWRASTGRTHHQSCWSVYTENQHGYKTAIERYPIENTDDGCYPRHLMRSDV